MVGSLACNYIKQPVGNYRRFLGEGVFCRSSTENKHTKPKTVATPAHAVSTLISKGGGWSIFWSSSFIWTPCLSSGEEVCACGDNLKLLSCVILFFFSPLPHICSTRAAKRMCIPQSPAEGTQSLMLYLQRGDRSKHQPCQIAPDKTQQKHTKDQRKNSSFCFK